MEYPQWAISPLIPEQDQSALKISYLIRRAALHHNKSASIPQMAFALGVAPDTLYASMRGNVTPLLAQSIENLVGRAVVTREDLCPEKFAAK